MNYENTEIEIANALSANTALTAIADVFVLPDDVENYKTPTIKGLVTVVFLSEKFDHNQSIGQSSQHSTVAFNISIQSRKLRGVKGVYAIAEQVKKTLEGFVPTDAGLMTLSEQDFGGWQNAVWEHSITFSCRSLWVQEYPNALPGNDITNGNEVYYDKLKTDENIHV